MKHGLFFLLSLISFFPAIAQNSYDVDRRIKSIPYEQTLSTDSIAAYIKNAFTTDADKVRAAYTWVVENIEYDTDSMYSINWNMGGIRKITESLKRRKGVCENFAGIFVDIALKSGLEAVTIDGYTKQANVVNKTGHTWAAVTIDSRWYLFDPTWDKDRLQDYNYFMLYPDHLSDSHMPFDPLWQLTETPLTHREFRAGRNGNTIIIKNYSDSVKTFMRLSELDKLEATARRINKADLISDLLRNRMAFLQMQIATIYEDRDMNLYNAAVADLNKATDTYNKFVIRMNSHEALANPQNEYDVHLKPALQLLARSLQNINDIGKYIPNYQYDPTALRQRVFEMTNKINLVKPQGKTLTKNN